eukprot:m.276833 g.276833  ORF g.276833 m.276833 type:complete len:59 (-) comp54860_c1_seq3:255-431(-)
MLLACDKLGLLGFGSGVELFEESSMEPRLREMENVMLRCSGNGAGTAEPEIIILESTW